MKTTKNPISKTSWVLSLFLFGLVTQLTFSCEFGAPEGSRARQAINGQAIFKEQCAPCHGMQGMKPTVDTLTVAVPDLTRININHGVKEFPVLEISRIIDGRKLLKAHGTREMPVWGEVYEAEGMDETEIKGRKGELIAYLMHIQQR